MLALLVGVVVWAVDVGGWRSTPSVLPDTEIAFSLDLEVIGSSDHDVVYAVEQRARPHYRILSFDPREGTVETVFTVPEDAIIYGITLSPDRATLAVGYSTDFEVAGNGVWLLDLASGELTEMVPAQPDVYLTDLEWSVDGETIYAGRVDRTADEQLDVVAVSRDGVVELVIADALDPTAVVDDLYHLPVEEDQSRRTIGRLGADGEVEMIPVGDGTLDLDDLITGPAGTLRVAGIAAADDSGLTVGASAAAHGNHDVPATWWDVTVSSDGARSSSPTTWDPTIVYDASSRDGPVIYATLEGLSIGEDDMRTDLIFSRAIRFVAA